MADTSPRTYPDASADASRSINRTGLVRQLMPRCEGKAGR